MEDRPLSGRRVQAAANDEAILRAAREVFVADPNAPIAAVAERAGVGISALYRRYPSKEALIGTLCAIGQEVYLEEVERALGSTGDPWEAWVDWLRRIVEADTHALVVRLAGTFTPNHRHIERAERMLDLGTRLFERTRAAGAFRPGVSFVDVGLLLELVSSTRLGDSKRTGEIRRRYLDVIIAGMSSRAGGRLPGRAPTWEEQAARWAPGSS
jgi:AcrR family transcriptional regulator